MLPTKGALHIFFMKNRIPERTNNASKSNKLYIINIINSNIIPNICGSLYVCVLQEINPLYSKG